MAFNGANDDSEWVVVSNETWSPKRTAEENSCVWFEPQSSSIIRADYFVPDPPPVNEENKEQTEVVGGGGLELVCRNSVSVVNPGPGATLSALQFDDITVSVPLGLKIGHDFADFADKRCDVWLPKNLNRDVKPPSEENPAPCASDFPYGSSEDETNDLEKNIVDEKEEAKSEVIAKDPDSNESSQKADALVQNEGSEICNNSGGPLSPFHPMAALCSFGMAAAAMGIVAIAKCFCRGGAPHTNNRVARSDLLGFHPQILRFDVCSEHQKIRELMLHSSRVSKGFFTSARRGAVPVSYHLSVGNSFDAI